MHWRNLILMFAIELKTDKLLMSKMLYLIAETIKYIDDCLIARYLTETDGPLKWREQSVKMMFVFKLQFRAEIVIRNLLLIIWNDFFHATRWIKLLLSLCLIFFLFIRHVVWKNHEIFVFDDCWRIWNRVQCSLQILFHMMITIDKMRVLFFFKFQLWKWCDAKYAKYRRLIRTFLMMTQTKR